MTLDWTNDYDDSDLPTGWAVPLDEPHEVGPTLLPFPTSPFESADEPPPSFLLSGSDASPGDEFHPRLRRFDEAA